MQQQSLEDQGYADDEQLEVSDGALERAHDGDVEFQVSLSSQVFQTRLEKSRPNYKECKPDGARAEARTTWACKWASPT